MFKLGDDTYGMISRTFGVLIAIMLWYFSVQFSVAGFRQLLALPSYMGFGLSVTVTYLQLLYNRNPNNDTLYILGIGAYIYGLGTTVVGILSYNKTDFSTLNFQVDPWGTLMTGIVLLFVVAFFTATIEILPEHLLINSLRDETDPIEGDFITSIRSGLPSKLKGMNKQNKSQRTNRYPNRGNQGTKQNNNKNQRKQQQNQSQNQSQESRMNEMHQRPMREDRSEPQSEVRYPVR